MEPKKPKPVSQELDALELTLTQDIELPFDEEQESRARDASFEEEEDFEEPL